MDRCLDGAEPTPGIRTAFEQPGGWFKGVVHVHTSRSDGKLPPLEAMAARCERKRHEAQADH